MPFEWDTPLYEPPRQDTPGHADGGDPIAVLHAWPYRSLPKRGFAFAIGFAYVALMIPVAGFVGTVAMWWLFFPGLLVIFALWWSLGKSYRDGEILEELSIWTDHIQLTRTGPRGKFSDWEANPHWVTVQRHKDSGPIEDYITLKGNGREVEIGAFLSDDERPALYDEIARTLTRAKSRRA